MRLPDADFLRPFPPDDPGRIAELFVDRDDERQQLARDLEQGLARPRQTLSCVTGPSRSGKSHLARLVAAEVAKERGAVLCEVRSGFDANAVLLAAYRKLQSAFLDRAATVPAKDDRAGQIGVLRAIMATVEPLLSGGADQLELAEAAEELCRQQTQRNYSLGLPTFLTVLGGGATYQAGGEREARSGRTRTVRLGRLQPEAMGQLIGHLCRALTELHLAPGVLLLLDDLDLFPRDAAPDAEQQLLAAVRPALELDRVAVLATVREKFARDHARDLRVVAILQGLDVDSLMTLYRRHCQAYHFDPALVADEALRELAGRCDGRPGWFLGHLRDSLEGLAAGAQPLDLDALRRRLGAEVDDLRRVAPDLVVQVEDHARVGRTELPPELYDRMRDSALYNRLVYESHRGTRTLEINRTYLADLVAPPRAESPEGT